MTFTPTFIDLVRNYTTTTGTGNFVLGAAVNGYTSFAQALRPGDGFYYSAIGVDKPIEREVGRGTLNADGTIARDPVSGIKTSFTNGVKSVSLIAAAEWFNTMQAGAGAGGGGAGTGTAASRDGLGGSGQRQLPVMLAEGDREGLFVFDGSNLSAKVAADPNQGIYIAPSSDPSGASGAWVRKFDGAVHLKWFGVAAGASGNAARVESAIDLLGPGIYHLPKGDIAFDRDVYIRSEIVLRGHGSSGSMAGSKIGFPAGCSGFRTSWNGTGGKDPYDAKFEDFAVYQAVRNTNTAVGNYAFSTRTFSVTGGTNDFINGQVVWIEGAGPSYTVLGKTATISAGSKVASISSLAGNPGVHIGQIIDIPGAGLPPNTIVVTWNSNSITLSNSAASSVAGAAYTVAYPLVARIVSGGGTANLVLDSVSQGGPNHNATGVTIRHADSGILADRPIQIENVGSVNFPIGINLAGDTGNVPPNGTNTSAVRYCRLSADLASLYFGGWDANASTVWGCDFQLSNRYGVLDLSLIGNYYFGCHFAFNVGIACPVNSQQSMMFGCYFEGGTSFLGSGGYAFGGVNLNNGSGWNYFGASDATGNVPSLTIGGARGSLSVPEAYLGGRSLVTSSGRFRIQANINSSMADGAEGIGLEYGADNSRQYVMSYNRTLGAYANLEVRGAQIDLAPAGTTVASVDPSGVNIAAGSALKIGGQQVVGARGASLPADATDLASAIALVNAIKARLKATGGHGLVAD